MGRECLLGWLTIGLLSGTGCALNLGGRAPEAIDEIEAPVEQKSRFGELRPGDWVPTHPNQEPLTLPVMRESTADIPPEPAPTILPPPKAEPAARSDPPLVTAVRAAWNDNPTEFDKALSSFDHDTQKWLREVMPALIHSARNGLNQGSPHEVAQLVNQLENATVELSRRASLSVEKAAFCRSVRGFGDFDPFPERTSFKPGQVVGLYLEVRNVPSRPIMHPAFGEIFVTPLSCTVRVNDDQGQIVPVEDRSRRPVPEIHVTPHDEFTRSPIRDYFVHVWLPVPGKSGSYTATIEVQDPATHRAVSKPMSFRVQ